MTDIKTMSVKRVAIYLIVGFMCLMVLSGCGSKGIIPPETNTEADEAGVYPFATSLQLTGDVLNQVVLSHTENNLLELIEEAQPIYEAYDVALIAADGFMVKLDGDTIADTMLIYDELLQWCYISEKHPVNSRIKGIAEVVIIKKASASPNHAYGLNLVTEAGTVHRSTGELLSNSYESIAFEDGVSELEGIRINVMKRKKCIRLSDIITEAIDTVLIMESDGSHHYEKVADGYIEVALEGLHYMSLDQSVYIRNIDGIMINPPATSIMNNFYDASYYLEDGQKVLTLFIDGFSYEQYEYIVANKPELFLSNLETVKKATTVFKPVTNAGFAAMVSGDTPANNGVHDRSYREVLVPTIFDVAQELGYDSILIEGDVNILKLNTNVELNNDQNGDGFTDDEIFENAKAMIYDGYHYAMVHFHSVDESGHDYGSLSMETLNRISVIDGYVETLAKAWDGKVIIVADHGMHDTAEGGDHGEFRHEDLFIPYSIYSN